MSNSFRVLGLGLCLGATFAACSFPSLGPAPEISAAGSTAVAGGSGTGSGGLGGISEGGEGGDPGAAETPGGSAGAVDVPVVVVVNDACKVSADCRPGLSCVAKKCTPAHSSQSGNPCFISDECSAGLQCNSGKCTPITNPGAEGEGCASNLNCGSGLLCALSGLAYVCVTEGSGDVGAACAATTDCYAGLNCAAKECTPGTVAPPTITVWPGVQCDAETSSPVRAYFEVPGAADADAPTNSDFFRLPFPNDARRSSKGLDLTGFPTPGTGLLGSDPVQPYVDAVTANDTAWGSYPTVTFRFSGALDAHTTAQQSNIHVTDITPGLKPSEDDSGNWSSLYSAGRTNYVCANWLAIERAHGYPLQPGHTYAFWLSNGITAKDGSAVERAPNLISLLSSSAPTDSKLTGPYAAYKPFRDYIATGNGVVTSAADVLNASVITVGAIRDPMAQLAASVAAQPAPSTHGWIQCGAPNAVSPCPQAEGDRACGTANAAFDEYQALVSLPIFQKGFPKGEPYLTPADGGDVALPTTAPREDVCLGLTIPKGVTMPDAGWPVVIFAHGTGGSFRSHMTDNTAGVLAQSPTPFAVLGIDQVEHGPRRGKSVESPDNLFFNFLNPKAARGNPLQGAADQLSLLRLVQSFDLTAAQTGGAAIKLDPNSVVYFGHSQGATEGSLAMPYADGIKAVVLSGNGASLKFSLLYKENPINIARALPIVLQDPALVSSSSTAEFHPALSLLQEWIDPADPLNFARAITRSPETGHTAKNVFETYGLGDTYAPPRTLQEYIIAGVLDEVTPDASAINPDAVQYAGIKVQASGVSGNVTLSSVAYTLGFREYGPPADDDGHFVAFDVASANADVVRFLSASISGTDPPPIGQ